MDPSPPVDRRAVLKGAAALAGAALSGAALAGCAANAPVAAPALAEATEGPARGRGKTSAPSVREGNQQDDSERAPDRERDQGGRDGQSGDTTEPSPEQGNGGGDGGSPDGDRDGDPDHQGDEHTAGPKDDKGDGKGGHDDDDDSAGPGDPGGPPPLVAVAAVPVGGGVVLGPTRVVVTQPVAGTFRCFGSRCTHAGCTVDEVVSGTIHCPCHGSLFDIASGEPVAGPAPAPLDKVKITVKAGGVYLA